MRSLTCCLLFVFFQSSFSEAGVILFGVDDTTDQLLTIDSGTGAATAVGPLGFGEFSGLEATSDGTLYGARYTTDELYTIDQSTGAASLVGSFGPAFTNIQDLAFNSLGVLYGFDDATDNLVTINLGTGAATTVVHLPNTNVTGLAFDASDRLLAVDPIDGKLFEVNQGTGALAEIGSLGLTASHLIASLDFDPSGTLFASDSGVSDSLYTIDATSGAATAVGSFGFGTVRGIVFSNASVPEPSSLLLACLFGAGVFLFRKLLGHAPA